MLTLAEMASEYKRTPKTFKKHVIKYGIPHVQLGRSMLFDPVAVSNHLAAVKQSPEKAKMGRRFRKKAAGSRFAEAVGI